MELQGWKFLEFCAYLYTHYAPAICFQEVESGTETMGLIKLPEGQ